MESCDANLGGSTSKHRWKYFACRFRFTAICIVSSLYTLAKSLFILYASADWVSNLIHSINLYINNFSNQSFVRIKEDRNKMWRKQKFTSQMDEWYTKLLNESEYNSMESLLFPIRIDFRKYFYWFDKILEFYCCCCMLMWMTVLMHTNDIWMT